jgi:hypothetical protein
MILPLNLESGRDVVAAEGEPVGRAPYHCILASDDNPL